MDCRTDQANTKPLVSVHIISFNQKQFIRETLDSVLLQDYDNLEIVVADDGSTDGTAEIILEYAQKYPQKIVPLVGGPNLGITGNSNRGLTVCSGKYIAFLGGDDVMLPKKLSIQVEYMEGNSSCAISYHDLEVFEHASGRVLHRFNDLHSPYSGGVSGIIKLGCMNGGSSTMVRASEIPAHGFDNRLPVASDWCFWIETLLTNNKEIHYINKLLGRYRRHGGNVTQARGMTIPPALRDHFETCTKILTNYPKYSKEALYRCAVLLRSLRNGEVYQDYLIASLRCSVQAKTIILLLLSWLGYRRDVHKSQV